MERMGTINEKLRTGETVVTTLTPPGHEIHACAICGGEIDIDDEEEKDADYSMVDQGRMKTVWHRKCYDTASDKEKTSYKNTLLRIE